MFNRNQQPTSQATSAHRRVRGIGRRVIVLGAMATALAVGTAGTAETAQAWTYADATGSAGRVALPRIYANDTQIYSTTTRFGYDGRITVVPVAIASLAIESAANPVAYRSPRTTGAQDVIAFYQLERWNGVAWEQRAIKQVTGRIAAGASFVRLPRVSFTPGANKGYYRVNWAFAWKVAGRATNLGSSILLADRASDFGCSSPLRPCEVGQGYVHVGRLYQAGGGW